MIFKNKIIFGKIGLNKLYPYDIGTVIELLRLVQSMNELLHAKGLSTHTRSGKVHVGSFYDDHDEVEKMRQGDPSFVSLGYYSTREFGETLENEIRISTKLSLLKVYRGAIAKLEEKFGIVVTENISEEVLEELGERK